MLRCFIICLITFSFFESCEKGSIKPHVLKVKTGNINIKIDYEIDNMPLEEMAMIYTTPNGYPFSVWKIQYIVSDFKFYNSSGVWKDSGFYFLDSQDTSKNLISIHGIPVGFYNGFSFLIGIKLENNIHNVLPATNDFQGMFWPDMMGGGYHFMKLEGRYSVGGVEKGYAIHIGENGFSIPITLNKNFQINNKIPTKDFQMIMNINEWFRNPVIYDFETDGESIMGDSAAMRKIAKNGSDVFSIN